jgi:hypothetical protein
MAVMEGETRLALAARRGAHKVFDYRGFKGEDYDSQKLTE